MLPPPCLPPPLPNYDSLRAMQKRFFLLVLVKMFFFLLCPRAKKRAAPFLCGRVSPPPKPSPPIMRRIDVPLSPFFFSPGKDAPPIFFPPRLRSSLPTSGDLIDMGGRDLSFFLRHRNRCFPFDHFPPPRIERQAPFLFFFLRGSTSRPSSPVASFFLLPNGIFSFFGGEGRRGEPRRGRSQTIPSAAGVDDLLLLKALDLPFEKSLDVFVLSSSKRR